MLRPRHRSLMLAMTGALVTALAGTGLAGSAGGPIMAVDPDSALPTRLSETGWRASGTLAVSDDTRVAFAPQYPLWSDGATKRRWIWLPPGSAIDASNADAWEFPPGTKLWKEFSHGKPVETRFIERLADGSWRYAAYAWNEDGSDATLVPADGATVAGRGPGGSSYAIPSRLDCVACHEGAPVPVLGFSALQLSPDRDPRAAHAERPSPGDANLASLAARGLLRNLPQALIDVPPRIAAQTPTSRAALGYLHANCGHCHNDRGPLAGLDLVLAQPASASDADFAKRMSSLVGHSSRFRPHGAAATQRIVAGDAAASVIAVRMRSTNALARMPPLGTQVIDAEGLALVERWIRHDFKPRQETSP